MFAKSIVLSDAFLDMPMSARCLYFTLGMLADDDGFVNNPKSIIRTIGASEDDMRVLINKRFVLVFDKGIIVIKHWRINNYLRSDRYRETNYKDEKKLLEVDENGAYTDTGIPMVDQRYTQNRIGKDSIGKNSICAPKSHKETPVRKIIPPTVELVKAYCEERHNGIDAEYFCDFYTSKNWMVGKDKMKDWQASVRTWEKNRKTFNPDAVDQAKVEEGRRAQEENEKRMEEEHKREMENLKKERPDLWEMSDDEVAQMARKKLGI